MAWTIRVLTSSAVVVCLAVLVAHGQAPKPGPAQKSLEVPLQQRVAALEKEVQSLKAELAPLRAQIQRSGSTQAPVASGSGPRPDGTRPSEAEIHTCVAAARTQTDSTYGSVYGGVLQFEFGTTITSQGGTMELAMGAPKGTSIFPTKIHFAGNYVFDFWVFKDSFGTLKCFRM
jgi:hypothetical protein